MCDRECLLARTIRVAAVILLIVRCIGTVRLRHAGSRHALLRFHSQLGADDGGDVGLWPSVFNVATKASISANATCGQQGREEFCRLAEHGRGRCGVCDNNSPDLNKRHPIENAIDGSNKWWQSPTLHAGAQYETVTITLDLKQIYQVVDVIVKSGYSPRPGSWILERSLDGDTYHPWQYFVVHDEDCMQMYGLPATPGKPKFVTDTDVICTSHYSKLHPLENGEIHTSLVNGRPGANESSPELLEFTRARYVRLRLLQHRLSSGDLNARWPGTWTQGTLNKRMYYAIRDISIVGQCVCSGHANSCRHNVASGRPECECQHHTCGPHCDQCCPLYNQRPWRPGTSRDGHPCEPCQCHGHATECIYDEQIDTAGLSLDIHGKRRGGGVCISCTNFTTGVNCEKCIPGYFRPNGIKPDAAVPCIPCDCDPEGSAGDCVQEPEEQAGKCVCRPGYEGERCDRCAAGYTGYPICQICPCDPRGTMPSDSCTSECICKANVEGSRCDTCKSGHFALRADNVDGCSACYCSSVTSVCESAFLEQQTYESLEDWLVCDIAISETLRPILDTDTNWLSIGNYELPAIEAYYWLAPATYTGNRLVSYGSNLVFNVNWVVMRGDTSGKPTTGPNVILVGANGLRIAHGDTAYTVTNATITVTFNERNWYHVPFGVKDIVTRLRRTEYRGDLVTHAQFMSVLADVKHVLLRAKFHTDQIEGSLESAVINVKGGIQGAVEKCACPTGYTGLSCEQCDYGYVKILTNTSVHLEQGVCVKCNCNGHSQQCDTDTGGCKCEHNTVGLMCERCAVGYYGNPLAGTVDDCKRCACPLLNDENNFSPSCQLDTLDLDVATDAYVCTQCPQGYTGDHCEICDYGYFGSPKMPGGTCELCSCNGGPCDRTTGQCLSCRGNTEGWRCERCKAHHYGDPTVANCQPCLCDPQGAVGPACDAVTGQCQCKERFTGRTCDRCQAGYGNVTAECPPCLCHSMGATSDNCDSLSGICTCKPGVEGFRCDACQHLHYGFSDDGCKGCACHSAGSELPTCDIVTGQCRCKVHVTGRNCDICERGYWGLDLGYGCSKCDCDTIGSQDDLCEQRTGQCACKPGVTGLKCDTCLDKYFGFSDTGCKPCESCNKPGHICDPDTGRCMCPKLSTGESCHKCVANSFGLEVGIGCKPCSCEFHGSVKRQCHVQTGECECKSGYTGPKCDRCAFGYYGYPRCRRCDCDRAGTKPNQCDKTGLCSCDESGQCACKANVIGRQCNECSNGTFGLHLDNPDGCTQCFCFGRTAHCTESNLTIGHIRLNTSRELEIEYSYRKQFPPNYGLQNKYFPLENDLLVIPGVYDDKLGFQVDFNIDKAIYWRLPKEFLGDKILSYGGYLRFVTETIGGTTSIPYFKHPLVQIKGNNKVILDYYQLLPSPHNRHEVRFHESLWRWRNNPNVPVSRDVLMVALQRVEHILIRANDAMNFNKVVLHNATLDTAIMLPGSPPPLAKGVELCECPRQYNSSSCQNPSIGFFRWHNSSAVNGTIVIDLIGQVQPCECNGRSNVCDTETGDCLNCSDNTTGKNCQLCAEGFYGSPMHGNCKPCPCPSSDRNFARKCHRLHSGGFKCICKAGYSGPKCDKCKLGYFGHPEQEGGSCQPCNCNKYGSASNECDEETGQCNCKPGMTGKDCSQCKHHRHVLQINGCKPCDNCTQWLLNDLDNMSAGLDKVHTEYILYDRIRDFYEKLNEMSNRGEMLQNALNDYKDLQNAVRTMSLDPINQLYENSVQLRDKDLIGASKHLHSSNSHLKKNVHHLRKNIKALFDEIENAINGLRNFGTKHTAVKNAVREGKKLLDEIKQFPLSHPDLVQKEQYCKSVWHRINHIDTDYGYDMSEMQNILDDFKNKLNDMKQHIKKSLDKSDEAKNKNLETRIQQLKQRINELQATEWDASEGDLIIVDKARELLNHARSNYDKLKDSTEFDRLFTDLKARITRAVKLKELREIVARAKDYAEKLRRLAEDYRKSFNISHEADIAIKASMAYRDIVDLLNEARSIAETANEQINATIAKINPIADESLFDESLKSVEYSDELKEYFIDLRNRVENLNAERDLLNISISDNRNIIWRTGLKDNDLNSKIHNTTLDKTAMMQVIHTANKIADKMRQITKNATYIQEQITYNLRPRLVELQKTSVEDVSLGEEKLSEAERNIQKSREIILSLESNNHVRKTNITKWNDTISENLAKLKSQILKAKQMADIVRTSITNVPNAICSRSYKPYTFGPSTTSTIAFTLSLNNTDKNSSLFYLPTASQDFMALQLVDNSIQYLWNLGGGTAEIKVPLPKSTAGSGWYRIQVERTANLVKLSVYNNETKEKPIVKMDHSNYNYTRFDLGPDDRIWIGGSGNMIRDSKLLGETGLVGCLSNVMFDGRPIGLWNFATTTKDSCASCIGNGVPIDTSDGGCYFNGAGYSALQMGDVYKHTQTSIGFKFKTYDEDALIFLAVDKPNKRFVSIYLKNGKIHFHVEYGGDSVLILTTKEKVNTGKETSVSAGRVFQKNKGENGSLMVNGIVIYGHPMHMPTKNYFPNLDNVKFYIGGVPPEFHMKSDGITKTLPTHSSFLGCIREIDINSERYNPLAIERFGVVPSCKNKFLKIAGFEGKGFVKMPGQPFSADSYFTFAFRTMQEQALLLASFSNENEDFYSVSLVDGKLELRLKLGHKETVLMSNKTVNDGHFHVVVIKARRKHIELRIDDMLEDHKRVDLTTKNLTGDIYYGGLPKDLDIDENIKVSREYLNGSIKEIIFNDKLVHFNDFVTFEMVKLGRPGPLPNLAAPSTHQVSTLIMPTSRVQVPEGCHRIESYSVEPGAVKFGDALHSYVQHSFKTNNFWGKDFIIEFEFRTFYLNGLIFVSPSKNKKRLHYILLVLKDNDINLTIKQRKPKVISLKKKYDDGHWHKVVIQRTKKNLIFSVDGKQITSKIPKKNNVENMMYIGSIPANSSQFTDPVLSNQPPFRGCIRGLRINNDSEELIREDFSGSKNHNKVGQCFPHVEKGSYFPGDAFAIYKYNFIVHVQLELQFEFRTSEQNGILLSIAEPENNQGLSLELDNGAVVMMSNMSNSGPSKVIANLSTEYSLCDNKWHKVSARYSEDEMTVNVDGVIRSSLAIGTPFIDSKIENALYIGGMPDDVPLGTLHSRENFKGCMRNVVIKGHIVDWTDMDELQNILLNSCPVTNS